MFSMPDLGDDLFHQPKTTAETLHSESDFQENFLKPATTVGRTIKFNPNNRINNRKPPKSSKSSVAEGPSTTSKFHDTADDEHGEKCQSELQAITKTAAVNCEYSLLDSLPLDNESLDVHGLSFPANGPFESLEIKASSCFPAYSIEERASFGNTNDLEAQSLTENEDLHTMEREHTIYHIEESNLEECAHSIAQNDEAEKSSRKVQQGNKKFKTSVDNMANTTQNTKNTPSEIDDDYDGNGYKDDDIPKQKKRRLPRKSTNRNCEHENSINSSKKASEEPGSTVKDQNTKNTPSEIDDDYDGNGYKDDDIPKQKKRKLPRKSTNRNCENENSINSSKKASEETGSTVKDPPKKRLSHGSSRCKSAKTQVNKAVLEFPDDELDRRQLVIRDLIRLAGFKERISIKEAAAVKNSLANQNVEHEQDCNGDDDANGDIQKKCLRLNYHSYMRRPLQTRWSKTDTEFFYQAIRQFGTDFAMIQVLFPNRSRQQVKAKFKNEQRKHPLQIADALVHRSKDHSHFEKVIQQLQAMAEQKCKNEASNRTAQSQDEADQKEEEMMEENSNEEQDVNCSEDWDGDAHTPAEDWDEDAHTPAKFRVSGNDFDQHSEANSDMEDSWM